jgi:hypothetical protein
MTYQEIHVPVWKPEEESHPVNLIVDVEVDEEKWNELDNNLIDILNYSQADESEMQRLEEIVSRNLEDLLDRGLIQEAYCEPVGVSSVNELEQKLDSGEVEILTPN